MGALVRFVRRLWRRLRGRHPVRFRVNTLVYETFMPDDGAMHELRVERGFAGLKEVRIDGEAADWSLEALGDDFDGPDWTMGPGDVRSAAVWAEDEP